MSLSISENQWFYEVLTEYAFFDGQEYEVTFLTHVFAFARIKFSRDYNGKWKIEGDSMIKI